MITDCSKCGQPLFEDNEYCPHCNLKNPNSSVGTFGFVPWWGWLFVVACGAIPVVTMGGAVPGALGFGSAAACAAIAKRPDWPVALRVAACAGISAVAWVVLVAFLVGVRHVAG